ncbi:hypothetical protein N9A81_01875 [Synechococcus sp. AH-707-M23]|nr:hypothetical protein [Synechococcus sp. AH-707-M23]
MFSTATAEGVSFGSADLIPFHEWRGCASKRRFNSLGDAWSFSDHITERFNCLPQRPYRCDFCGGLHLTTT